MLRSDRFVAIIIILISVFLYTRTGAFKEEGSTAVISAAFFPRMILILLILCCASLTLKSRMKTISFPAFGKTLIAAVLIVGYVFLIEPAGYFVITPIFLLLLPIAMGYRRWLPVTLLAIGGTIFSFIVFYKILGVPLPLGILETLGGMS